MSDTTNHISHWTNLRDGFAAVRELMIVLLIVAFLLVPQRIQQFLHDAGVRSVAGVEFDWQKFKDAQNQIELAKTDMQEVHVQLNTVSSLLAQMQSTDAIPSPSVPTSLNTDLDRNRPPTTLDVDRLLKTIDTARSKSQDIDQRLQQARQYSQDAWTQPVLVPPEQLFGKPPASNTLPVSP